jgi:hypothetical protein
MVFEWRDYKGMIYARCTYEGGCKCCDEDNEPSLEDCFLCGSFEWVEDQNHSKEDLMI